MKLATKFVSVFVCGAFVLIGINAYFAVDREVDLFERDMQQDAHRLGKFLESFENEVFDVWRATGRGSAVRLAQIAEGEPLEVWRIRWVWLDATAGDPYQTTVSRERLNAFAAGRATSLKWRNGQGQGQGNYYTYYPIMRPVFPLASERLGVIRSCFFSRQSAKPPRDDTGGDPLVFNCSTPPRIDHTNCNSRQLIGCTAGEFCRAGESCPTS